MPVTYMPTLIEKYLSYSHLSGQGCLIYICVCLFIYNSILKKCKYSLAFSFTVYHNYSVMILPISGSPNSFTLLFLFQVRQKPPAGRSSSRQQPAGGSGGSAGSSSNSVCGGGGSSGASSSSSSTRASPAGTIRAPTGHHGRPALASNFSLDDITAQLEKVKYFILNK